MHFRNLVLFYFRKVKSRYKQQISAVYGDGALAENIFCKWFATLRSGNFDLIDRERPGSL